MSAPGSLWGGAGGVRGTGITPFVAAGEVDDFFAPGATFTVEARHASGEVDRDPDRSARGVFRALVPARPLAHALASLCFAASSVMAADVAGPAVVDGHALGQEVEPMVQRALAPWVALNSSSTVQVVAGPVHAALAGRGPHALLEQTQQGLRCSVSMQEVRALFERYSPAGASAPDSATGGSAKGMARWQTFRRHIALHEAFHCESLAGIHTGSLGWKAPARWLNVFAAQATLADRDAGPADAGARSALAKHVSVLLNERYADARALIEVGRTGGDLQASLDVVLQMRDIEVQQATANHLLNDHDTRPVVERLADLDLRGLSPEQASGLARELAVGSVAHELPKLARVIAEHWLKSADVPEEDLPLLVARLGAELEGLGRQAWGSREAGDKLGSNPAELAARWASPSSSGSHSDGRTTHAYVKSDARGGGTVQFAEVPAPVAGLIARLNLAVKGQAEARTLEQTLRQRGEGGR